MHETSELTLQPHELERTTGADESAVTPVILLGAVWGVAAAALLDLIAIVFLAYDFAK